MAVCIMSDKCIGCGACVATCPCDVFRIDKNTKKAEVKYASECQVCSMCTLYCPVSVIVVTPDKLDNPMLAYE